jgi:hypothetical protein
MTALTLLFVGIAIQLWEGFVIMKLWNWFITVLGVPAIEFWHAVGLALFVSILNSSIAHSHTIDNLSPEKVMEHSVVHAGTSGIVLLLGWGVHSLM